jgi:hypothetical protein
MSEFETEEFEITETCKLGKDWEQELVVSRGNVAFLRLAGDGTNYRVMTATAGQSDLRLKSCDDPLRLLEAASLLSQRKVNCIPNVEPDGQGREYVQLFDFVQEKGQTDKDFTGELHELVAEFFEVFDELKGKTAYENT